MEFRKTRYNEAKRHFENAIEYSPGKRYGIAMSNLGAVYENLNFPMQAEIQYKESINASRYKKGYLNLAGLYFKRGYYNESIQVALEGLKHHPTELDLLYLLGKSFLVTQQLDRARKVYREIYRINPNYKDVGYILTIL